MDFTAVTVVNEQGTTVSVQCATPRAFAWLEFHGANAIVERVNALNEQETPIEQLFQRLLDHDLGAAGL